jgi:hypothetical protein
MEHDKSYMGSRSLTRNLGSISPRVDDFNYRVYVEQDSYLEVTAGQILKRKIPCLKFLRNFQPFTVTEHTSCMQQNTSELYY